jgi:hypothetical protein
MSYLEPTRRGPRPKLDTPEKIYLNAGEAIVELNKISKEANESIKFEQALRAYWLSLAEELGEELRLAAIENNRLWKENEELLKYKQRCEELEQKLQKVKSKAQIEREEEIELQKQKRKRR